MKLLEHKKLTATLKVKSGLHIGSGEKPAHGEPIYVIKMPTSMGNEPYIPGSSIKGKMRSLLEVASGKSDVCTCGDCSICKLFGSLNAKSPGRLIFRDSFLTEESKKKLLEEINLEEKPGVQIDRKTGAAKGKALFTIERVPKDCKFDIEISVRIFEGDMQENIRKQLALGLFLIEQDTLGGSGTRGSGWIEFENIKFDDKEFKKDWREKCKQDKNELLNELLRKD